MNDLIATLLISTMINLSMFLVAYKLQSDKLTDISYALTFFAIALYGLCSANINFYHTLLFSLIVVWAFRLGSFLLYRVIKNGGDRRFDGIRENFAKFGVFWMIQAITVWVLMISSILAFESQANITNLTFLGVLVWLVGLVIETAADIQKFRFSSKSINKGKWIDQGIWKYSRHPNYFGEIMVWVGVYIVVVTSLSGFQILIALISPLYITVLLLFVSGIPILEKLADKKWGSDRKYLDYKLRTSVLLPLPLRK